MPFDAKVLNPATTLFPPSSFIFPTFSQLAQLIRGKFDRPNVNSRKFKIIFSGGVPNHRMQNLLISEGVKFNEQIEGCSASTALPAGLMNLIVGRIRRYFKDLLSLTLSRLLTYPVAWENEPWVMWESACHVLFGKGLDV